MLAKIALRVASVVVSFYHIGLQPNRLVVGIYLCLPITFFTIEIAGREPCLRLELAVYSLRNISDRTPLFYGLFDCSLLLK